MIRTRHAVIACLSFGVGFVFAAPPPATNAPPAAVVQPFATGEKRWTNSLGMVFVRVPGTGVLFSIWETRIKDYSLYAETNPAADTAWRNPLYHDVTAVSLGPDYPVVNVSWTEAKAFCTWLGAKEQSLLPAGASYRLPTDAEWSAAVGIADRESGATPRDKDRKLKSVYPWGTEWPPPTGSGNFADATARQLFGWPEVIKGYDDGYATASPVGSFQPNNLGICDLAGNALEWCEDWYDSTHKKRVLRGGAWVNHGPETLWSSYRNSVAPDRKSVITGFRCVLSLTNAASSLP